MPLNFPSSPTTNTTYTFNTKTWTYNGNAWALSTGGSLNTSVVPEGSNLYFSNARVYSNVSQLGYITSSSLSGYATNSQLTSYATKSNVDLKANIADLTAANITGTTLNPTIVSSSLTTVGTLGSLTVSGISTFNGNVNITGNLNVTGPVTTYTSNTVEIADTILYLATGNSGDVQDIGFAGHFTNPGYQHTGLVRDASDGVWKLFANVQTEPSSNTLDFTTATYSPLTVGVLNASSGTYTGNVNSSNVVVTGTSRLGTITAGTWNGSSIATTYTDAKIAAVSNTDPVSVVTSAGTATVSLLSSGVSAATYGGSTSIPIITVDTYGRITNASNVSVSSGTTITDDTATNATRYLTLTASSSGSISTANVSTTKLFFNPSTGLLTSTDYNSSSDERLKKNIKTVENAVEKISALRGVTFDWKEGDAKGIGLIAQEVNRVLPDVVTTDENGYMGVKYTNIIGILVEAIKEQQEQINTLKKQIEKL